MRRLHVLVVDDHAVVREGLTALLERVGFDVLGAGGRAGGRRDRRDAAAGRRDTRHTIESRRARLMKKLHIHDMAGLVRYAVRRGLVQS